MDRRISGGLMLLVALVSALVVPRISNPTTISGAALIAPPSPPPAVGSCLMGQSTSIATDMDGVLQQGQPVQVVPCTGPHGSEILYIEPSVMPAKVGLAEQSPLDSVLQDCSTTTGGLWNYLGMEGQRDVPLPSQWVPSSTFSLSLVGPSTTQRARGEHWVACVLVAPGAPLTVPLRGIVARSGGVPPELAVCFADEAGGVDSFVPRVNCTEPHTTELLGETSISDSFPPGESGEEAPPVSRADLTTSCRSLAAAATNRSGLLDEPSLSVQVLIYTAGDTGPVMLTGEIPAHTRGWADCMITATDPDRQLTESLRLFGDKSLPWK